MSFAGCVCLCVLVRLPIRGLFFGFYKLGPKIAKQFKLLRSHLAPCVATPPPMYTRVARLCIQRASRATLFNNTYRTSTLICQPKKNLFQTRYYATVINIFEFLSYLSLTHISSLLGTRTSRTSRRGTSRSTKCLPSQNLGR